VTTLREGQGPTTTLSHWELLRSVTGNYYAQSPGTTDPERLCAERSRRLAFSQSSPLIKGKGVATMILSFVLPVFGLLPLWFFRLSLLLVARMWANLRW
jgi:hypothetical protein